MFVGEDDSPFGNLPPEMIVKIFKYGRKSYAYPPFRIPNLSYSTARQVCRRWRWIVDDPWWGLVSFKAKVFGKESSAVAFMKSRLQYESLFITGITKTDWPQMSPLELLPKIQKLTFGWHISEETLITILSCGGESLEYLNFLQLALASVTSNTFVVSLISRENWSNLTELHITDEVPRADLVNDNAVQDAEEIEFQKTIENHYDSIATFLRLASLPKLKIFNFYLVASDDSRLTPVISDFTCFLERHRVTLKDLSLSICLDQTDQPKFSLVGPIFTAERQESIGNALELESFNFLISHSATIVNLVPPCLWESSKLTNSIWSTKTWKVFENDPISSPLLNNPVESMILRSQVTLVSANIMFGNENSNDDIFQLHWLETCSALRDLTITYIDHVLNNAVRFSHVKTLTVTCRNNPRESLRFEGWSGWITRSFENVEKIRIYGLTQSDNGTECEWLENLFLSSN